MEVDQKSLVSCCALVVRIWLLAQAEEIYLTSTTMHSGNSEAVNIFL